MPDHQLLVTLFWEYFLFLGFKVNCGTNSSEERQNGLEGRQKYMTVWACEGKRAKECVEIFSSQYPKLLGEYENQRKVRG